MNFMKKSAAVLSMLLTLSFMIGASAITVSGEEMALQASGDRQIKVIRSGLETKGCRYDQYNDVWQCRL